MSVCDGFDTEDPEVKQEPMDHVKLETGSESADTWHGSLDVSPDAQIQKVTESGKLW